MGEKDIISKQIFKHLVRDFATYLFGLAVTEVELLETSQERIEDRHADLVARVAVPGGECFILHIEIQHTILARLMERMREQPPQLREYVSMLEILASNRDLNVNISEEFEMLSIGFKKPPTYRIGINKTWNIRLHLVQLACIEKSK